MSKEGLIVIIGPTAVGKTDLSIELAKRFSGEIISGDSMQIYKRMDIGTAKVTRKEMAGVPHHLIDIKEPDESFSVAEFQKLVKKKITEITARGNIPIIVGGTGLYITSVLYDYNFSNSRTDEAFREEMELLSKEKGNTFIHNQLKKIDPVSAELIHPNNVRRVIRALEIYHTSGKLPSETESKTDLGEMIYKTALIGLTMEREQLYERINRRVDIMVSNGLLEEVKMFYESGLRNCQSIQAIGYKEIYQYFDGEISLDEAINQLKQNSRRYAKRQLTWFRNKMSVEWFNMSDIETKENILEKTSQYIEGKLTIKANI